MIETIKIDKKLICVDYDGTITSAPFLFNRIIELAKRLGFKVIICTMRGESEKDSGLEAFEKIVDKIYYTNRKAKKKFLNDLGIYPWVWIDDNPEWIFTDTL